MPYKTNQGFLSSSLRLCCAIGGIVGLSYTIGAMLTLFYVTAFRDPGWINILHVLVWITLLGATYFEKKFLVILFFVGFALEIIIFLLALLLLLITIMNSEELDKKLGYDSVLVMSVAFLTVLPEFLIAAIIFRYVYSYFHQIRVEV